MKKTYLKPFVDVDNMIEQDMLCLSLIQEQGTPVEADESDVLGRDNHSIWDDED